MAEKTFTIVYKRAPDYRVYAAPVIYGGPSPDGRGVLINVCVDHAAFPSYVEHAVNEAGLVDISKVNNMVQVGNVEREVQAGIYLSLDEAERTLMWLDEMVKKMKGERNE